MKFIKRTFSYIKELFYYLFLLQRRFRERIYLSHQIKGQIEINPILRDKKNRDKTYLRQSKIFQKDIVSNCKNTDWHYVFSMNSGIKKLDYISEELFFLHIEPALNKIELSTAISDKMSYENYFDLCYLPKTFFKITNNQFFNAQNVIVDKTDVIKQLSDMNETLVIKPALKTGGGRGVIVANAKEIASLLISNIKYSKDSYIIQERVEQHHEIAKFHPNSLNTYRIMTARVESEIVVLGAIMRFGRNNSRTDNGKGGGIACAVDKQGFLSNHASDNMMNRRYYKHPETEIEFNRFRIPNHEKAVAFCVKNHQKFIHFTFISWDMGIRENGNPVLIEYNLKSQEIAWHQHFNGPLFGEYTDYFIRKYQKLKNRKRYWI